MTSASVLGMAIFSTFAAITIDVLYKRDCASQFSFGCGTRKTVAQMLSVQLVL
jgi:hypothetical protein